LFLVIIIQTRNLSRNLLIFLELKMTEKELIAKLKKLGQIEPRKDWVLLTKEQILGSKKPIFTFTSFLKEMQREMQRGERLISRYKPVFATALVGAVLLGLFGFAQRSLPGDALFSLKKITEKSQAVFISQKYQSKHDLEIVNKRLDEATKIAENDGAENIASAVKEVEESMNQAAKSLAEADSGNVEKIVEEVQKLEEKTEKLRTLGVKIEESEELNSVLAQITEREIKDLEGVALSEEKEEILVQIKEDYQKGDYSQSLEKILLLNSE